MTTPAGGSKPPTSPVERLFVLWIISTLCLVLLASVLTVLGSGRMHRQALAIQALVERVEALEHKLNPPQAPLGPAAGPPKSPPAGQVQRKENPGPTRRRAAERDGGSAGARSSASGSESGRPGLPAEIRTDEGLSALLDRVLPRSAAWPYVLADRAAAADLLMDAVQHVENANWSGPALARLAMVARLLDEESVAELLAARAMALGTQPLGYLEISARNLLARGRIEEARVAAQRFARAGGGALAHLLLAEAWLSPPGSSVVTADEMLAGIPDVRQLTIADRLRAGRLAVMAERWDQVAAVLASLESVPPELADERDYLRAVLFVREGRLVEALGAFDYLADRRPEDYDVLTWRGAALVKARSYEEARKALAHAEQHPQRPEAWYWRALVELRSGNVESAARLLEASLTASPQYAPAWEALAGLALERRDLATAVQNLALAIQANPRRASAHMLLAIAHAKASRRDEAEQALREALRLDPAVLETARRAEVITRLFEPELLEQMAIELAATDTQPATSEAEAGR